MPQSKVYNFEDEMKCKDCGYFMNRQKRTNSKTGFIWRCATCRRNRFPLKKRSEVEEPTPLCECHGETMTFVSDRTSNGYYWMCRMKFNERHKEAKRNRYRNNPEKARMDSRRTHLKSKFGLSLEDYDAMVEIQKGVCAICEKPQRERCEVLHIDHNHKTGKVRGLLCMPCNTSLGFYESFAADITDYLEKDQYKPSMEGFEKLLRENPDYSRSCEYRRLYGISIQMYNDLLQLQDGVCGICSTPPSESWRVKFLAVDHDHETSEIRGLLCNRCNTSLGFIEKMKISILQYLKDCDDE